MFTGIDWVYYFIYYVGYWGGIVWMPILGYYVGELFESFLLAGKKPKSGGILGAVVGLVFWFAMISPRLTSLF